MGVAGSWKGFHKISVKKYPQMFTLVYIAWNRGVHGTNVS